MSDPTLISALFAAVVMGLVGSPHCVGMCGGIATALAPGVSSPAGGPRWLDPWLSLGRVTTYAMLGALAGGVGSVAVAGLPDGLGMLVRGGVGLVLVLVGLSVGGFWPRALAFIEGPAAKIWARLSRGTLARRPVRGPATAFMAGGLWGLLPCGLVYAALVVAMGQGSAVSGAALMAAFGLATLPAILGVGWLGRHAGGWLTGRRARGGAGVLLVVAGLWTMISPLVMSAAHRQDQDGGDHAHAEHHASAVGGFADSAWRRGE